MKGRARFKVKYVPGIMNRTEAVYARLLDLRQKAGEVQWWAFESMKLKLADNTTYTPDFAVITSDERFEFVEIKGFWRDDARVKIKVAASLYPWAEFIALQPYRNGWKQERFNAAPIPRIA